MAGLNASSLRADDARPDAKQLLSAAHQVSDLSPVLPYTLQGTVVINPGTENQKKGSITIYRDHERSRSELRVEDYLEVKLVRDNKLYIYRSTPLPVPLLGKLAETDHSWDKLAEDGDAKLGDVAKKKARNEAAYCFDVKGEQRHRLCFSPERNLLLEVMDAHQAVEFTNYSEVDGHFFPGKITVLLELEKQEKPVLVVENIQVMKAQFAATAFAIPPHAMEFDTCENIVAAKPLETPTPEFSTTAMRRNAGAPAINVYGIIAKNGSLENVKVLTSDTEVQQTILEAMKKWRYTPAMCGSSPVASEKEIQVLIFRGAGGGDGEGARRGR
ncbi:MAG TPA: hypothetical protein VH724_04875 [Candidatus Angelobacter sp.]|nr:hypothetical protein [Candidatus Angelobacter sp.]